MPKRFAVLILLIALLTGCSADRNRGPAQPEQAVNSPLKSEGGLTLPDEPWVRELSRFQPAAPDDPIWDSIRESVKSYNPLVPGTVSRFTTDDGIVTVTVAYPIRIPNAYQKDDPLTVIPVHGFVTGLYHVDQGSVHLRGTIQDGRVDQWGEDWVEIPLHPNPGGTFLQAYDECRVARFLDKETRIGRLKDVAEVRCTSESGAETVSWYAPGVGLIGNNGMEIMEYRGGTVP